MLVNKPKSAFRTISEVATEIDVATHVIRFWETKFSQIAPMKRNGGRRYYRPDDVELLIKIKHYLHDKRYTIEGVQKLLKEKGVKGVVGEEIQKDFIEMLDCESVSLSVDNKDFLNSIRDELVKIKENIFIDN